MPFVLAGKVGLALALSGWVGHLATTVVSGDSSTAVTQIVSLITSLTGLIAAIAGLVVHLRHRDSDVVYVDPGDIDADEDLVIQHRRVVKVRKPRKRKRVEEGE